jgi:uncharacterized membrane-anchored protein
MSAARLQTMLFWLGLALALASINYAVAKRERLLTRGDTILLELAPVDPRSLMQGDYMALRFRWNDDLQKALGLDARENTTAPKLTAGGHAVIEIDAQNIARLRRVHRADTPLAQGERLLRYRLREGMPKFGTNAFFFQEGHAEIYASARYGEFRVDAGGDAILVAMRSDKLERLAAPQE